MIAAARIDVFPASPIWPANTLRCHVRFPEPMRTAGAMQRVALLDERRRPVDGAFLDVADGLWDPEAQWLTLHFHPARVKSGLTAARDVRAGWAPGRAASLRLDGEWTTVGGASVDGIERPFRVGPVLRGAFRLADWRLCAAPGGAGRDYVLCTDRPMDVLSLDAHLRLVDPDGRELPRKLRPLTDDHTFAVELAMATAEPPRIAADARLEDVAGNRADGAFERRR